MTNLDNIGSMITGTVTFSGSLAKSWPKLLASSALAALLVAAPMVLPVNAQETEVADADDGQLDKVELYRQLNLLGDVFDRIREDYVDLPNEKELIRAAINGMLTSLDPHSRYMSPQSTSEMREENSGEFSGLGIEITMVDGLIKVISPIDDTPADRAGILAGDLIVEINDEQVFGLTQDESIERMRGPIGSDITVTIVREGINEPFDIDLQRGVVTISAVRTTIENDIGILRLSQFTEQAYDGIEKGIKKIVARIGKDELKGIILDLRNNPGGLVNQAVEVADAFLTRGEIVSTRGRNDDESTLYNARSDDLDKLIRDLPLIVLINGGSASSSEIVAGALQDQRRATLIGTRSFGKGSVQTIIPLGIGNGAMRLTTSRYFTPSGASIQAKGITPDIEIFQDIPEELRGFDETKGEAGLRGHLDEGEESEPVAGSSVFVPRDRDKDNQLQYAFSLLRGQESHKSFPAS